MSAIGCFLSWRLLDHGRKDTAFAVAVASTALLVFSAVRPHRLQVAYNAWMKLGALLHKLTSPLIMLALFTFVFIPGRMILAAFGKRDLLNTKWKPDADSYWIPRSADTPKLDMKHQF